VWRAGTYISEANVKALAFASAKFFAFHTNNSLSKLNLPLAAHLAELASFRSLP